MNQRSRLTNMKTRKFIKRINKCAEKTGQDFNFNPRRGKGSHGRIQIGDKATMIPDGEMRIGTIHSILKQLGIDKKDF